jgi:predicted ArsR family transcriptional regulator/(2Fe-2S) ferredoxin
MSAYIDLLKATRAEIVNLLKRQGGMSVEALAGELAISKVAVRRHLDQLEEQGFIDHCSERCERGRPRFVYSLTAEGNGLFPDTSAAFACDLMEQVSRAYGEVAVAELLAGQASVLIDTIRRDVSGLDFDSRVRAVAKQFNDRGYVADVERLDDGSYRIVERNCPIREVASRFPQVCREELRVYGEVTGGTVSKGECRIASGATSCEYRIVPGAREGSRRLPIVDATSGGQNVAEGGAAAPEAGKVCGGKHQMAVCVNVHCEMNGANELVEHLVVAHGVAPDVESDAGLSLELTYCFGACDIGPNVEIDGVFYDGVTPDKLDDLIAGLDRSRRPE